MQKARGRAARPLPRCILTSRSVMPPSLLTPAHVLPLSRPQIPSILTPSRLSKARSPPSTTQPAASPPTPPLPLGPLAFTRMPDRVLVDPQDQDFDPNKQERLANLGDLVRAIEATVPGLLRTGFKKELLSEDVVLRILPHTHPTIPEFVGRVACTTATKLLQLTVSNLLLPPNSELLLISSRLEPTFSRDCQESSRLLVRWRTWADDDEGDHHHDTNATSNFPSSFSFRSMDLAPSSLVRALNILPHEYPVLTGIFEFDFDKDCSHITVMTVNDIEYLSKPAESPSLG